MAAQKKHLEDHGVENGSAPSSDQPGTPIDSDALRSALLKPPGGDTKSYVRTMHEQAEAVFAGYEVRLGDDIERAWSLRRQFVFIVFASALSWAAVLAPIALIF